MTTLILPLILFTCIQATPPAQEVPPASVDATNDQEPVSVNRLLDRLEKSGASLKSLHGDLTYRVHDSLLDEAETRIGRVVLQQKPDGDRRFAFVFEEVILPGGRGHKEKQAYIYRDGWLIQLDHAHKQMIKRQLVEDGSTLDPLKIGEGPIPIPIGQPRAEVLARFEAGFAPAPDHPLLKRLKDIHSLRLVPRVGTSMAEDTERIDIHYDRKTLAPIGIDMLMSNGDRKTAMLRNVVLDRTLATEEIALLEISTPASDQWTLDVRPLKK